MPTFDLPTLLRPVSEDDPCGPDLVYDADFVALETASRGKAEQQYGQTVIPAEPPNWREVRQLAVSLLSRSKDLRVASHLARAVLETDGLTSFCEALTLVQRLAEDHWEGVHPRLDPEDDNDPAERANTIGSLADASTTIAQLERASLIFSQELGVPISIRAARAARGEMAPAPGDPALEPAQVDGAFLNCDLAELSELSEALSQGHACSRAIEAAVTDRVGAAQAMSLERLTETLAAMRSFVSGRVSARGGDAPAAELSPAEEQASELAADESATPTRPAAAARAVVLGEVNTRDDVVRALDKVCQYYDRYEPSSPVPLLLRRARRLVTMNFLDILNDLAPDAVSQARQLGGVDSGGG
ncbi:MAG: type VI secretion system protein TssA [Lacipirellulaceae bacterium]